MISGPGLYLKPDGCQRILSLSSDVWSVISRHDPARWRQTLSHRSRDDLPFDPLQIPTDASLLFDSTVYIDQLKGQLPAVIVNLIASRIIFHAAPALAELAVIIEALTVSGLRNSMSRSGQEDPFAQSGRRRLRRQPPTWRRRRRRSFSEHSDFTPITSRRGLSAAAHCDRR
jgi:hypothetical protein